MGYDAAGRLTRWTNKKGFSATAPVLSQFDYTYDAVGNRTSQRDSFGTHNFTYDSVYRLLGVDDPAETFTYDAVGNRLSSVEGPANLAYTYNDNNQLTAITKDGAPYAAFTYDDNGGVFTLYFCTAALIDSTTPLSSAKASAGKPYKGEGNQKSGFDIGGVM